MNRVCLYIFFLATFLFGVNETKCQISGSSIITLNYSPRLPVGDLSSFIGNPSWISFDLSYIIGLQKHWSAGFSSGYTRFYKQIPRTIYTEGPNDISAVQTRQLEVIPVLARARYQAGKSTTIQPYLDLGFGAGVVIFHKYWGVFGDNENRTSFRFCLEPEAGSLFRLGKKEKYWIHFAASYMFIPYQSNDLNSIQYLGFKTGIGYQLK